MVPLDQCIIEDSTALSPSHSQSMDYACFGIRSEREERTGSFARHWGNCEFQWPLPRKCPSPLRVSPFHHISCKCFEGTWPKSGPVCIPDFGKAELLAWQPRYHPSLVRLSRGLLARNILCSCG